MGGFANAGFVFENNISLLPYFIGEGEVREY